MAKKHYTPKDINKNNKLDPWEVAKYEAINSATPMLNTTDGYKHLKATAQKRMGHQMNFGSKQVNTPSAFSNYDYGVLMGSLPKVEYVNPAGEENISMQAGGVVEVQPEKPAIIEKADPVAITSKAERVGGKIQRLERRKALQEFKGRQRLDKGFTLGANQKRKRIANIEKRQNRLRNRLK